MSYPKILKHGLAALSLVALAACGGSKGGGNDQVAPGGDTPVTFDDVNAVFTEHCAQCHLQGPSPHFVGHEDVVKQNAALLTEVLTTTDPKTSMPKIEPTTPLTDAQKQAFVLYQQALRASTQARETTYASTMMPILQQSCAQCHGDHGGHGHRLRFVGHQDVFDKNIDQIVTRVTSTHREELMPPIPATPLTADEKAKVLSYLKGAH